MKGTTAFALANGYTDETVKGGGALKGKNCTIQSTSFDADGNSIVTFAWSLDDGTEKTTDLKVDKGVDAKQITSIVIDTTDNHVKVTMDDGTVLDAGEMPLEPIKVSADSGNALVKKADGLYVSTTGVEISAKADNIIKAETDGLYAKADEITISAKSDNIITKETDGLYVPSGLEIDDTTTTATDKTWSAKKINDSIKVNADAIDVLNGDATVSGSVTKQITEALAKLNKLEKQIVDALPSVADADANTIYLIKQGDTTTYDMYTLVTLADGSKSLASMGGTEIDLDGYAKTDDVVLLQQSIADKGKSLIVGDDGKVIVGNAQIDIVTEFAETTSDEKVPSEKLVKDSLDTKADSSIVTGHTNLDVGADFNTLIDYGTYRTTTKRVDRIDNLPIKVAGMLEVRNTGSIIYQTYKTVDDDMYIRSSEDSGVTWADWKKVSTGADGLEVVRLTKAEYDALTEAEKNDPTKLYDVYDEESLDLTNYAKKTELKDAFYAETKVADCNNAPIGMSYAEPTATNKPINDAHYFFLNTIKWKADENWQTQIAYDLNNGKEYRRQNIGDTWDVWKELATMDKFNYSTDEVEIGTYMGEPLYRKCIIVEGTSSQGKIDFNNIKGLAPNYNVISLTGTLDALNDGQYTFPVPYTLIETEEDGSLVWYRLYTYYDKTTGSILFNAKSNVSAYYKGKFKLKLIAEYTK